MAQLLTFFAVVLLAVALTIAHGWAISTLWGWHIVPFGLPALSWTTSIGIAIIAGLLTKEQDFLSDDYKIAAWQRFCFGIARPFFAVFMGWLVLKIGA